MNRAQLLTIVVIAMLAKGCASSTAGSAPPPSRRGAPMECNGGGPPVSRETLNARLPDGFAIRQMVDGASVEFQFQPPAPADRRVRRHVELDQQGKWFELDGEFAYSHRLTTRRSSEGLQMVVGDARLEDAEQDSDERIRRRFDQLASWFDGAPTLVVDGGGTTVDVTIEDGEAPLEGILPTAYRREEGLRRRAVRAKMIERFSPAHRRRAEWFYRVGLWRGRTFEVGQPPLGTETVELDDAWYLSEAAGAVRVPMQATLEVAGYKSCPAPDRDCLVLMAELDPADDPLSESIDELFRAEAASDGADGETGNPHGWVESETRLILVSDPATLRTYRMLWSREEEMHVWAKREAGRGIRLESRTTHRRRLVRPEDEAGGD